MGKHVFVTGVTGFMGKVVLEQLVRRRAELKIDTVYVLIRRKRGTAPARRFRYEVMGSRCFSRIEDGWERAVEVVAGELTEPRCGLSDEAFARVTSKTTHIIHCAASVDFHLPIAQAAASNITSALNMLQLARKSPNLVHMIDTSTAYVTPTDGSAPIRERLAPLPRAAEAIYRSIVDGTADQGVLLKETGHPNTYTYTKCVAEHLLMERRGDVPLTILRPSIISAAWRHPFPGWIDSAAAFAGFVMGVGSGHMRVLQASADAHLDLIPVDEVADRALHLAFITPPPTEVDQPAIVHATAGVQNACRIGDVARTVVDFYRRHPVHREPALRYIGPGGKRFAAKNLQHHKLPVTAARAVFKVTGQKKLDRQAKRLVQGLDKLNSSFPYFTTRTFDFRSSLPMDNPQFNAREYVEVSCAGVYRYLLQRNEAEVPFAGRRHVDAGSDLAWMVKQPRGNWAVRGSALTVKKALKRSTELVTFDQPSFERAIASVPEGALTVLIPSHRSYMDFVLVSYLAFARPDLGIAIPRIAATSDFKKIPVLGELFKHTNAFYIKRGLGREDPDLTRRIRELAANKETLEFFIEGTRSRSRQFLRPKRGLLRALQNTGASVAILPIALTYDRVPEESVFATELAGSDKPKMQLRGLLKWSAKMSSGKVSLGRVHMTCGEPVLLDACADVRQVADDVMDELQSNTATTTFHLRSFLRHNEIEGIDLPWLRRALLRRGGQILDSRLQVTKDTTAMMEQCMRYQWLHLFYPEAVAAYPNHPAIRHHCEVNGFATPSMDVDVDAELADPCVRALLKALFEPICRDYVTVAWSLGSPTGRIEVSSPKALVRKVPTAHLPNIEACFNDLVERRILKRTAVDGEFDWGPRADDVVEYEAMCRWPEDEPVEAPGWSTVVWA